MRTRYARLLALAIAPLTLLPAGCNIVTPVAYAIHGPDKVEPAFELDKQATTVVFVDDPASQVAQRRLRYTMADNATRTLLEKKIVADMLDSRTILNAATKERYGEPMSITELGKAVGADVVIYAVVSKFSMSPEQGTFVPTAQLRVKVIDVANGQRVWPASESGYLVDVRIKARPGVTGADNGQMAIEQELADRAGLGLAQLFYKHELPDSVLNGR